MIQFATMKEHELIKGRPAKAYFRYPGLDNSLSLQVELGVMDVRSKDWSESKIRDIEALSDIHLQLERLGLLDSMNHADPESIAQLLSSYRETRRITLSELPIPKILPNKIKVLV